MSGATFRIGDRLVGQDQPTYFVADIAANHDGDLERAKELIDLAAEARRRRREVPELPGSEHRERTGFRRLGGQSSHQATWKKSVFEVYAGRRAIPLDWTPTLVRRHADEAGIDYFSAPVRLRRRGSMLGRRTCRRSRSAPATSPGRRCSSASREGRSPSSSRPVRPTIDDVERADATPFARRSPRDRPDAVQHELHRPLENLRARPPQRAEDVRRDVPRRPARPLRPHAGTRHGARRGRAGRPRRREALHRRPTPSGSRSPFSMDPHDRGGRWSTATRELEAALGSPEKGVADNERRPSSCSADASGRGVRSGKRARRLTRRCRVLRPSPRGSIQPYEIDCLIGTRALVDIEGGEELTWLKVGA